MSSLAIMRGSRNEISNAPIVDGQIFIETDQIGTEYNNIYMDNNNNRIKLGINNWNDVDNKLFESVGNTLSTANNTLSINTEWNNISNKPFETIGVGLNVDEKYGHTRLNADITEFYYGFNKLEDFGYQCININDTLEYIHGGLYIEQEKELSTTDDNIFIFNSFDEFQFNKDTEVEIYVSIWNYYPKSVRIKRNKTCVITFPSFYYPYTYLTCRVYLKEV